MSLIDASRLNTTKLVYMVEDMLPECGAGFFWGPSGSGKTFTILDAALSVCNSVPFLGHATLPGSVAYMCGEGQGGLGVRVKGRVLRQHDDNTKAIAEIARTQGDEAARSFAATLPPYTSDNLKIETKPFPLGFSGANKPNPDLEQAMGELRRLNSPGPEDDPETWPYLRLVILDALENFAGQLSVSHRSSANKIIASMQWMAAELQCCVLAVAHPVIAPGGGMKMVGSDRLFAAADFVIQYAPDDVAAPGALSTATISCQKSKDDTKFASFGVELHPCRWDEPKLDENWEPIPVTDDDTGEQAVDGRGNPVWETEEVTSQTVRLIKQDTASTPAAPGRPVMAPPELRDNRPASRVRPILRPDPRPQARTGLHLVTSQDGPQLPAVPAAVTPAVVVPAGGPASARQELVRVLLARRCSICSRPTGMGCDQRMAPAPQPLARTASGQTWIHEERLLTAALSQPDPEAFLERAVATLSRAPAAGSTPAPAADAPPAPSPDPLAGRLSWTTVRPDSPAPSLAQIFAGA